MAPKAKQIKKTKLKSEKLKKADKAKKAADKAAYELYQRRCNIARELVNDIYPDRFSQVILDVEHKSMTLHCYRFGSSDSTYLDLKKLVQLMRIFPCADVGIDFEVELEEEYSYGCCCSSGGASAYGTASIRMEGILFPESITGCE